MTEQAFADKHFTQVKDRRMAYIDEGDGDPIVFQHGNPTSSYLWRNVMPACQGRGRLVACDLIGMGDSDKLPDSGPERYTYAEQRDYLFALWEALGIRDRVTLVLHDWGSALGFEWASLHPDAVKAIVYMEAIVAPMAWAQFPEDARGIFQGFRSDAGEELVLDKNLFVEAVLPSAMIRQLTRTEHDEYRRPFLNAGEDRRPTLTWPRQIPLDGEPREVVQVVEDYGRWLANSPVPKLFINAEPGSILVGEQREFCRRWPNQREVTVPGKHFVQEDSPGAIGAAIVEFLDSLA